MAYLFETSSQNFLSSICRELEFLQLMTLQWKCSHISATMNILIYSWKWICKYIQTFSTQVNFHCFPVPNYYTVTLNTSNLCLINVTLNLNEFKFNYCKSLISRELYPVQCDLYSIDTTRELTSRHSNPWPHCWTCLA